MPQIPLLRRTRSQSSKLAVVSQNENCIRNGVTRNKNEIVNVKKRKNDESFEPSNKPAKRAALGDISNAIEKKIGQAWTKKSEVILKPTTKANKKELCPTNIKKTKKYLNLNQKRGKSNFKLEIKKKDLKSEREEKLKIKLNDNNKIGERFEKRLSTEENDSEKENIAPVSCNSNRVSTDLTSKSTLFSEESVSYTTASEDSPAKICTAQNRQSDLNTTLKVPDGINDYDKEVNDDLYAVADYAMDVFRYYRNRESKFVIEKYLKIQPDITKSMRMILVDWMVEVQESYELNHETLYLAVKLVDLYLSKVVIPREKLQLVASTSVFIACKFDERSPPYVDDFLYICDDAYTRRELLQMEIKILKCVQYDLGVPLSYRFLRRYARCSKVSMENLTFARYILELSLMEYDLIDVEGSRLAASALYLALYIRENEKEWSPTLAYYTGYQFAEIYHIVQMLHQMLLQPPKDHINNARSKYSHRVFFEVARTKVPDRLEI